jgi:hypothetical protein
MAGDTAVEGVIPKIADLRFLIFDFLEDAEEVDVAVPGVGVLVVVEEVAEGVELRLGGLCTGGDGGVLVGGVGLVGSSGISVGELGAVAGGIVTESFVGFKV